ALREAGWSPIVYFDDSISRRLVVLKEYLTANGPADYVLFHSEEPLAIGEAKRQGIGAQNVVQQAQRYARGLSDSSFNFQGYGVPFTYSSDGDTIWFQDLRDAQSRSRQLRKFHTPGALREMLQRDTAPSIDK